MGASRIAPKLYQGSLPPCGPELAAKGFHTLVLCAAEWQPADGLFPGVDVVRCPFDDRPGASLTERELRRIRRTATLVAARVCAEQRTLVTCAMGLNRSGFVTALVLTELYGCSGDEAVRWVRRERDGALFNSTFVEYLGAIRRRHPSAPPAHVEPRIILP